jgi:uncharacterized protein (DUF305 family)
VSRLARNVHDHGTRRSTTIREVSVRNRSGNHRLARVALPNLTDERLRTIAQDIVGAQSTEIEELRGYRQRFYGPPDPLPLDEHQVGAMDEMALTQATH